MSSALFRFCPRCAGGLEPFGDEGRERRRCPACGWIHYRNPTTGVAVAVLDGDGRLLLGRRRAGGGWCIPCGHVEWDEAIEDAARRELREETGLEVALAGVLAVHSNFHDPEQHTVGVWYRGRAIGGTLRPGGDLVAVEYRHLRDLGEAPPELVFPTDRRVVERLRAEAGEGSGGP